MKTIGLIGGMSWESTTSTTKSSTKSSKKELGGLHSAKILLYSVDFAEIEHYQAVGDWEKSGQLWQMLLSAWSKQVRISSLFVPTPCTRLLRRYKKRLRFQSCILRRQLRRPCWLTVFKKSAS